MNCGPCNMILKSPRATTVQNAIIINDKKQQRLIVLIIYFTELSGVLSLGTECDLKQLQKGNKYDSK